MAQQGPSFDCAKAASATEKAICADSRLATADRAMTAAYATLKPRLGEGAKQELANDQAQWIAVRDRVCGADSAGLTKCLGERYAERTKSLEKLLAMGGDPFVSTKYLVASGKRGKVSWSYEISYPLLTGKAADFAALNAQLAADAKAASARATPGNDIDIDREQEWTYQQSFTIERPGAHAMLLTSTYWGYSGGAHGYGAADCKLIDLRGGKAVPPERTFARGDHWLEVLVPLVTANLKQQFIEKPGFEEVLEPVKMSRLLREPSHYCWQREALGLSFNPYEVGPYVSGPFEVDIPMATLRPLLRADGPLGD